MLNIRCNWAPIPLRLVLGFGMIYHGWPKLFDAGFHEQFVGGLDAMGVPMPVLAGWGIGTLEVAGGLFLMLGALTRLVSLLMIIEMLFAIVLVHLPSGFVAPPGTEVPGYELNVLYIAGLLSLLIGGAGRYSIDSIVMRAWRRSMLPEGGISPAERSLPKHVSPWRRRTHKPPPVAGD